MVCTALYQHTESSVVLFSIASVGDFPERSKPKSPTLGQTNNTYLKKEESWVAATLPTLGSLHHPGCLYTLLVHQIVSYKNFVRYETSALINYYT